MIKNRILKAGRGGIFFQASVVLIISILMGVCYNLYEGRLSMILTPYTPPPSPFESIDTETLAVLIEQNMAIVVDARESEEFEAGHITNAVSLPLKQFKEIYEGVKMHFTEGKTIVTYCSSETCTDSEKLAEYLKKKGHTDIMVFRGGYELWMEYKAMNSGGEYEQ